MATNILASIPARYTQFVIVCETYKDNSIKGGERVKRGVSGRYVLTSPDMKVPYDFNSFLCNGKNEGMLQTVMISNKLRKLQRIVLKFLNTGPVTSKKQTQTLLGLHTFSGNDYISSFFRKGKQA
ncbi:uncharacterized protein LOC135693647, partial [Rhopilema esculentum]|uniref:uncharacterized protein LOC135693647 n=1 Tax=Rhopilema esculentum TaxID=499914 RepID=UPI0031D453C1